VSPIRSICPEIGRDFDKQFPPTPEDRDRPAREYLKSRGINHALKGLPFSYSEKTRKGCGGAVMFPLGERAGKPVWNGRMISTNLPKGEGKTHNIGPTSGLYFWHPGINYDCNLPTYVTEGIIDALSFIEFGHQATAVISSGSNPDKLKAQLLDRFKRIVLAFDNDPAGHKALCKWTPCLQAEIKSQDLKNRVEAIMLPRGDWNDFLLSGPVEQVKKEFQERWMEFRTYANLALANTAQDWATIHYGHFKSATELFLFEFNGCYWSAKIKKGNDNVADEVLPPQRLSNFVFRPKYRLLATHGTSDAVFEHRLTTIKRNEK
jgi:hypothetical protein